MEFINDSLTECWYTVYVRVRMIYRKAYEWINSEKYVKLEDRGTDPMYDRDEESYEMV